MWQNHCSAINAKDFVIPLEVVRLWKGASYVVAITQSQTAQIVSSLITSDLPTIKEHIRQILPVANYLVKPKKLSKKKKAKNFTQMNINP